MPRTNPALLAAPLAAALLFAPPAPAQETPATTAPVTDGNTAEDSDALPKLAPLTEGFTLVNNNQDKDESTLFQVYTKEDRVIAVIPSGLMDTPWLLGASVTAGPIAVGEQIGTAALEFRRRGKVIDLYEPELRYRATPHPELADGVKRVYTDRHIATLPIIAEGPNGPAIDLTKALLDNMPTLVGSFLGAIDASAARLDKAKAFNRNVEIALAAPVRLPWYFFFGPPNSGQLQVLHFSFSALPDNPDFPARPADQRVGYWTHAIRDIGTRDPLGTDLVRTIERWDLRKANPGARMSSPVQPIVFYIEKTVPAAYRLHVRRGIEAWNEAFRAIGIEGAIEVRQQTDTQYADVDPEDVRNNFVRWVPTGFGYAIALHRTDPRTGQILDADIVIDDGWINAWANEYPLLTQQAANARLEALRREDPALAALADRLEDRARVRGLLPPRPSDSPDTAQPPLTREGWRLTDAQRRSLLQDAMRLSTPGVLNTQAARHQACHYATRLGHDMSLATLAWSMNHDENHTDDEDTDKAPMIDGVPEDLIAQNLVALTAHEVGHILGLRHNFAASAWKPASAIDDYTDPTQEPPCASVMDYVGTFIAQPGKPQGVYNMTRVGPYDRWAIAYGYMDADDDALAAHLAQSSDPAHRYLTDEHTYSIDPTAMTYDFGSDPVEGRTRELERIDRLRASLTERLAKDGQSWGKVNRAFQQLWFTELFALWDSTGWIGGTYLSRDANTPGARSPLTNIEPERQRAVLNMLIARVFSQDSFPIDRDLLNHLQQETWYIPAFGIWSGGAGDFNIHNQVNLAQYLILSDLFYWCSPRLVNQELRTDPSTDALTLPELHTTLTTAIWSEFDKQPAAGATRTTNLSPKVSALRRGLQREHLEQLVDLAYRFGPFLPATLRQAQPIAVDQLRTIKSRLEPWATAGASTLDDYTRIHINETLNLINATLEAQVSRAP